jgi:leucyl-tRNA synthetase
VKSTACKQANYDLTRHQFNTVASATMKMLNALEKAPASGTGRDAVMAECFGILLRLLSPIAPHITHALWQELGYGPDILQAAWPEPLEDALRQDEIELVLQVNGKLRGNLRVAADAPAKPSSRQPLPASTRSSTWKASRRRRSLSYRDGWSTSSYKQDCRPGSP